MKKIVYIICFLNALPLFSAEEKFESLYKNHQYSKALKEAIHIAKKQESSIAYYNLGNCFFRLNQYGQAKWAYERALKLDNGNKDAAFNLKVTQTKFTTKTPEIKSFFLSRIWQSIMATHSVNSWTWAGIITFFIAGFFGIVFMFSTEETKRKLFFYSALFFFVFGVITHFIAWDKNQYETSYQYAIIPKYATLRSEPTENSKAISSISEGIKVEILDEVGDYYQIQLPNKIQGWAKKDLVWKI